MTLKDKQELIRQITSLLETAIQVDCIENKTTPTTNEPVELLTIKECAETVTGLSEYTVRQLTMQKKIPYIRTGKGKTGKILVSKSGLLNYLNGNIKS